MAPMDKEQRELALVWHQVELNVSREEGFAEGRLSALREVFGRLLTAKFGAPSEALLARVATADEATLLRWLDRIISAETLEAVFER